MRTNIQPETGPFLFFNPSSYSSSSPALFPLVHLMRKLESNLEFRRSKIGDTEFSTNASVITSSLDGRCKELEDVIDDPDLGETTDIILVFALMMLGATDQHNVPIATARLKRNDLPCARGHAQPGSRGKESPQFLGRRAKKYRGPNALRARESSQYYRSRRRVQSHAKVRDLSADVGQVAMPKPRKNCPTYVMFFWVGVRMPLIEMVAAMRRVVGLSCGVRVVMMIAFPNVVIVGIVSSMVGLVRPGLPVVWGASLQFCDI